MSSVIEVMCFTVSLGPCPLSYLYGNQCWTGGVLGAVPSAAV